MWLRNASLGCCAHISHEPRALDLTGILKNLGAVLAGSQNAVHRFMVASEHAGDSSALSMRAVVRLRNAAPGTAGPSEADRGI